MDRNAEYLGQARAACPGAEWVRADMREFAREGAFDAALNLYSSFGYFEDPEDDLRVARNVRASLRPGGAFVVELKGAECLARQFQPKLWEELEDGSFLLVEHEIVGDWESIRNRWILLRGAARREFPLVLRLYSAPRLAALLEAAGFRDVATFGWFDGRPYDDEATRLVVVGRSPPPG